MKKPFGVNFITFVSVFQIMFSAMTLIVLMFILGMTMEAGSEAYTLQYNLSMSLFNRPVEALTMVHYSIAILGTLLPTLILLMVLRMIKSKNLKFIRSLFVIKLVLDLLRFSILNIIIDAMMLLVLFADKKTLIYFKESSDK